MSTLEGSITFQAFGAFFFGAFFPLPLLMLSQKFERNRQEYQPIYVKNRFSSAAEWLSPLFGTALLMAVYHKILFVA